MATRRTVLKGAAGGAIVTVAGGLAGADPAAAGRTAGPLLRPQAVTSVQGSVSGANRLLRGGAATLTYPADGPAPVVVLDYGCEVGGYPVFEIVEVSGSPRLEAVYSDALPWLLPDGDGPAPGTPETNAAAEKEISYVGVAGGADLSRVERLPLRAGRFENRLLQGGERFQALRLTRPGSVTLRVTGIRPAFRLPDRHPAGAFAADDDRLTETWALGAYTLDAASVPAGAIKPTWDVSPDGLRVTGSTYSGYQAGARWTDYTATFRVRIERNEAAWLVRGNRNGGVRMVLCAADDTLAVSTPDTLRIYTQFDKILLAELPLPQPLHRGAWHAVRTEVAGTTVTVRLDGILIGSAGFDPGFFFTRVDRGWVAFGNAAGAEATFRDLDVVAADGQRLYRSALTDRRVLDLFGVGRNALPSILDGPKRDRLCFTGDLGVAGLNVYTSNFALEYARGTLELFRAYQFADGKIPTAVPPQNNPGRTPNGDPGDAGILDYTVHHVTSVHDYWWHTGDLVALQRFWPSVRSALGYLHGLLQPSALIASPSPFGGPLVPETLSNAHYAGALQAAVTMARAVGDTGGAAAYRARIEPLRAAVNRLLYNDSLGVYGTSTADLATVDQHANAYAVLYGVAPPERVPGLLDRLADLLRTPYGPKQSTAADAQIGPYTAGYDLLARFHAGDTAGALGIVRAAWRPMLDGNGDHTTGTAWEYVALDGTPGLGAGSSLCHPWSTMPTPALSKYVLGVRPLAPGYARLLVEPQPGDLRRARGRVPTPHGPVEVRWHRVGDALDLSVTVPRGTTAAVGLPTSSDTLTVDGHRVPAATPRGVPARPGYTYAAALTPGRHRIAP